MSQYALLTVGNPKTAKGKELGYAVAVLHLAPSTLSGHNVCPMASEGCIAACLNTAGRGGIFRAGETTNTIQQARIRRTKWLYSDRSSFIETLKRDVLKFAAWCATNEFKPAIRLNGTSDLDWDGMAPGLISFMESCGVIRYDYTKVPSRIKRETLRSGPAQAGDYRLCFSLAENNADTAAAWLIQGGNVAVVFRTAKLPTHFAINGVTRPVVDGDENDLRFLDPHGVIVGLKAKGRAKKDTSGFVRDC